MSSFIESASTVFDNNILVLILLGYLIFATYTDIKYLKIYNGFNLSLVLVRILFVFLPIYGLKFNIQNIFASAIVFTIMLTIGVIFMHKMGGDIKFMTAFMLFFDVLFMFVFMAVASIVNLIYSLWLKSYLMKKKKKILKEESENDIIVKKGIIYKINSLIVKTMIVKQPTVNELIEMNENDFRKFKLPFAPFFLISYIFVYFIYMCCK